MCFVSVGMVLFSNGQDKQGNWFTQLSLACLAVCSFVIFLKVFAS